MLENNEQQNKENIVEKNNKLNEKVENSNLNENIISELEDIIKKHYNNLIKYVEQKIILKNDNAEEVVSNQIYTNEVNIEESADLHNNDKLILELKEVIISHYANLRSLIKFVKSKDANIMQLTNEVQKYREGYCDKVFKSIALPLISFREDCRKAYDEMGQYNLEIEKIKKYMKYLVDNFEELLSEIGLEEKEEWLYNGKSISIYQNEENRNFVASIEKMDIEILEEVEEIIDDDINAEDLKEYLKYYEEKIQLILKKNEELDKCLNFYIKMSKKIEEGIVFAYIYPSLRMLISLNDKIKVLVNENINSIDEENKYNNYNKCLLFIIDKLEEILLNGGVNIYTNTDDVFDVRKNRLLKTIETNDQKKDRKIAKKYTECYLLNDNVIYPSKVDVYKYKEKEVEL